MAAQHHAPAVRVLAMLALRPLSVALGRQGMMPPVDLTHVVVVGTSCSGKTTLARRLARILASEHVELDSLYWGSGWTPRPDFIQNVLAVAQQPR